MRCKSNKSLLTVIAVTIFMMILIFPAAVHAASCTIQINGKTIETDAEPIIESGRTLVPVATIVDYLGGSADWDSVSKGVTLKYGNNTVNLKIGATTASVNGKNITMEVAPRIVTVDKYGGGRTMVPIRLISESFGYQVGWDGKNRVVSINAGSLKNDKNNSKNQNNSSNTSNQDKIPVLTQTVNHITNISISAEKKISGDSKNTYTLIEISADKSLKTGSNAGEWISSPTRYFIDFPATSLNSSVKNSMSFRSANSVVSSVRTGHPSEGTVRIVVDLAEKINPTITYSSNGKTMEIYFRENSSRGDSAQSPTTPTVDDNKKDADSENTNVNNPVNDNTAPPVAPVVTNINNDTVGQFPYNPYADGKLVVCIDPGHGQTTGGKRSPDSSLMEWEFNRSVAYKLKPLLEANGIQVIMTVEEDDRTDPSLKDRVAIANNAGNVDLFVSIHANASGSGQRWTDPSGWEVYSWNKGTIAENAAKSLASATKSAGLFKMRGTKTANFYVIKNTTMPSILIEHGFYTNYEECQKLKSDYFRNAIAQVDCTGILNFFAQYK